MTREYPAGEVLDNALGATFHQYWPGDFSGDAYAAMEHWFRRGVGAPVLEALIADIDSLFASTPDASTRLSLWPYSGLWINEIDDLLRAVRRRAVDALAGQVRPLRSP